MRIGIDCRTILNPGYGEQAGVGHYTYYLVTNLLAQDQENEYVLFFDERLGAPAASAVAGGRPRTKIRFFPFHEYRHLLPLAYSHVLLAAMLARERLDLYHLPAGTLPLAYGGPTVVTVHDLAIVKHPQWFPRQIFATRVLMPQTLRRARRIIAVSEHTRSDLKELFGVSDGIIDVIPNGVDQEARQLRTEDVLSPEDAVTRDDVRSRYDIRGDYVLFVGTLEPRKNITGLVEAFLALRERRSDLRDVELLIVGARGWKSEGIVRAIERANRTTGGRARALGYVPHREKYALMREARCFLYPSFYEGFGLPILEAMAQGTPVVSSNVSSIPEVAGDAALLVSPHDTEALSRSLERVLTDPTLAAKLRDLGRERAKRFSWRKTAEMTLETYKTARS